MIRYKCAIYCRAIDFVLDCSQFEEPIVKNISHAQVANNRAIGQTIGQEQLSDRPRTLVWGDRKQSSNRPNDRPTAIKQSKVEIEWTNNQDQRLNEAERDQTSKRTMNQTIENNCLAKPKMMANDWSNKHKNNYNHLQHQTKSAVGQSSGSETKNLEPAGGLEPTAKPDVQEVDVGR